MVEELVRSAPRCWPAGLRSSPRAAGRRRAPVRPTILPGSCACPAHGAGAARHGHQVVAIGDDEDIVARDPRRLRARYVAGPLPLAARKRERTPSGRHSRSRTPGRLRSPGGRRCCRYWRHSISDRRTPGFRSTPARPSWRRRRIHLARRRRAQPRSRAQPRDWYLRGRRPDSPMPIGSPYFAAVTGAQCEDRIGGARKIEIAVGNRRSPAHRAIRPSCARRRRRSRHRAPEPRRTPSSHRRGCHRWRYHRRIPLSSLPSGISETRQSWPPPLADIAVTLRSASSTKMRPPATIGVAMTRPPPSEPAPASADQRREKVGPSARLPKALVAEPPGCIQPSLLCAAGRTIGSVACGSSPVPGAGPSASSRVPGRTVSLSPVTLLRSRSAEPQAASPRARGNEHSPSPSASHWVVLFCGRLGATSWASIWARWRKVAGVSRSAMMALR